MCKCTLFTCVWWICGEYNCIQIISFQLLCDEFMFKVVYVCCSLGLNVENRIAVDIWLFISIIYMFHWVNVLTDTLSDINSRHSFLIQKVTKNVYVHQLLYHNTIWFSTAIRSFILKSIAFNSCVNGYIYFICIVGLNAHQNFQYNYFNFQWISLTCTVFVLLFFVFIIYS